MKKMAKKLSVSLDQNLVAFVKQEASMNSITTSKVVEDSIKAYKEAKIRESYKQISTTKIDIPEEVQFEAIRKIDR